MKSKPKLSDAQTVGAEALVSYARVLAFLTASGKTEKKVAPSKFDLPFIENAPGITNLYLTLSSVAPAVPGSPEEEWNPLSQRPHTPLPPPVEHELGSEVTALKEAVDAFTTLSHEMMHVALWEPFFAGLWRPKNKSGFKDFALRSEGFCFFFSDIIVSGLVRTRLPDGEFALERRTPSNARFSPVRAFQALGMDEPKKILDVYLDAFNGQQTTLWRPRGTSHFVASLAAQVYEFYSGSQQYLDGAHGAIAAFGGLTEFFERFCAIPGLPTFLDRVKPVNDSEMKNYFARFFASSLKSLEDLSAASIESIRRRRMLQTRAYYALQIRWLLSEGHISARGWTKVLSVNLADETEVYLSGLHDLLLRLARDPGLQTIDDLTALDAAYDFSVRKPMTKHQAWVGHRWLIAPHRAGGLVSASGRLPAGDKAAKVKLLQTVAFLVDELSTRMRRSPTVEERAAVLGRIQKVAALGAVGGEGSADATKAAWKRLCTELGKAHLLELWSVPLASFDPVGNEYRELVFSYQ